MALYVGTNYHPHDWTPERWKKDIALMKEAGFQAVRLGHLCWDSYEPQDGVYNFQWFDEVMNGFYEAGIKVFLDVSVRPAPVWVHKLCPGCDIFTPGGNRQAAVTRYMEDVDDPDYQFYALRFAREMVRHYKDHPAMMAFGLCTEQGAGFISSSDAACTRFQVWLKEKYKDIDSLNKAWNTQRWSRRLNSFEDVVLPCNETSKGAPEAYLEMRRFFGDGVLKFMIKLKDVVEQEAPGMMHSSNHVSEGDTLGFDYLKGCREFVDYPGVGFYPDLDPEDEDPFIYALMINEHRLAELNKPMWCIEFQTGNFGCYAGKAGILRMYALLCLAYRTQMVLAWTWRSMLGGEEQFFFGLVDHDGTCGRKYHEFAQIASDYHVLEEYGFPYLPQPEIALAYCYENLPVYEYGTYYYRTPYKRQIMDAFKVFHYRNLDCNFVDLRNMSGNYKILVIPGHAIMTEEMARNVRNFVKEGGIAIMTAYSAKVNENNSVFDTFQPGLLSDVFGLRVAGFERTMVHPPAKGEKTPMKNLCVRKCMTEGTEDGKGTQQVICEVSYWELLELSAAQAYACYEEEDGSCAVSVNRYGKGKAYYTSAETSEPLLDWLYGQITEEEGINPGIDAPEGVVVRKISEEETLYVNTTSKVKEVMLEQPGKGVLKGESFTERLVLTPFDGELIVCK